MNNDYFFNQITWSKATTIDGQECYLSSLLVVNSLKKNEVQYVFFVVIPEAVSNTNAYFMYSSPTMIEKPTEGLRPKEKLTLMDVWSKDYSITTIVKEMLENEKMVITGLYQGEEKVLLEAFNMRLDMNKKASATRKDKKESNL